MKMRNLLLAGLACASAAPLSASEVAPRAETVTPTSLSVRAVMQHVRQAVGLTNLTRFGNAFAIVQADSDGAKRQLSFGTRRGEVSTGREFVDDGAIAWQADARRNLAVPASIRQREKLAWPLWVRGYWWLNPASGFAAQLSQSESNQKEIAIALSRPDGVVGATVYVDRSSWLPTRVVVPYERGPFTERYSDYRSVNAVKFPFAIATDYRNRSQSTVLSVTALKSKSAFSKPAFAPDHGFDAKRPAALTTRDGVPFPNGVPGHVYVRASVDGGPEGWWHFDSGADTSIIDESVARTLGMEVVGTHRSSGADGKVREGTWRKAKGFTVGRLRIDNAVFRAMNLSGNNAPPGERRMGTIGYDVLARAVVEWGRNGHDVRICDPGQYRLPGGARWQRLRYIDSTPAFPATAEGHAGLFQIDTGTVAAVDFTKSFTERNRLLESRKTQAMNALGSGGTYAVQVGQLKTLQLAGRVFRDLEVSFRTGGFSREGSAGTIGRDVLNRFTLVFDYPHQRLAFLPVGRAGHCG